MNFEDFIKPNPDNASAVNAPVGEATSVETEEVEDETNDLDVQKAVVESLAADKAEQEEHIVQLRKENYALKSQLAALRENIAVLKQQLENVGDLLAKNSETPLSSKVTVLERNLEIDDKFDGETHDHILEALKLARDLAEQEGRARCAQLLDAVLLANEPVGNLLSRRNELEKLFAANLNVVNGQVINELDKLNIPYKHGENYLLPSEIIKFNY